MPNTTLYQLDLLYEIPGKQGAMTFHFQQEVSSPGVESMDSEFCFDEVAVPLAGALAPCLPDVLSFLGAYIRQATIATPVVYPFLGLFGSPVVGSRGAGQILPEGQGPLVLLGPLDLSVAPRRQVNRKYFPVMLETDQEDGAISSNLVTLIEAAFSDICDFATFGSNFSCQTYSRLNESEASTPAWPAATYRVSDQIARLVRRRPRFQGRS